MAHLINRNPEFSALCLRPRDWPRQTGTLSQWHTVGVTGKIRKKLKISITWLKHSMLTSIQSSCRSQKALVRKPKMCMRFLGSISDRCQIRTRDYRLIGAITSSVPYAVPLINKNSNLSASRYNTAITAEKELHLRWRRWESLTEPETKTISRRSMSLIWPTISLDLVMSLGKSQLETESAERDMLEWANIGSLVEQMNNPLM